MFKVRIVTPEGLYMEDEVNILNVVTPIGQMGILSNRMPLVTTLEVAIISTDGKERKYYACGEGTLQFQDNLALLLVDFCEAQDEIDVDRAKAARDRAIALINSHDPHIDLDRAQRALKRAKTRLQLKGIK